ncbi:hypothetical protein MCEZLEM10_00814 [Methylophilaceae bacterium]
MRGFFVSAKNSIETTPGPRKRYVGGVCLAIPIYIYCIPISTKNYKLESANKSYYQFKKVTLEIRFLLAPQY